MTHTRSSRNPKPAHARWPRLALALTTGLALAGLTGCGAGAGGEAGGEASLRVPDLASVSFFGGAISGKALLALGLIVCLAGLIFGLVSFLKLRNLPVHYSMREVSELIWETCKTYLQQQGKFLLGLWAAIAVVTFIYYQFLIQFGFGKVLVILLFSIIGMGGSYGVAWYGIRLNTFANSRTAFGSLRGKPYPGHAIPMQSGMSVGMVLISVELTVMLFILLVLPGEIAGSCFIGFAIGESLGASALRIAGGIFTKIADVGADLMKIVFHVKEDDARNPGVIADCTGDNAGDSVGPSADGFETYGVTGVALITFILLAVPDAAHQVTLLVWIFAVRVMMIVASFLSYGINWAITKAKYENADTMDYEAPLTSLVWITSAICIVVTFLTSLALLQGLGSGMWWKLSLVISCGTLAGALIPELVKAFTSTNSKHVKEVVVSAKRGGPSLDILSGVVSGNFSGYWIGVTIAGLMGVAFLVSNSFPSGGAALMAAPAVFAFGLVAFGFLGMGPVTIAVDSYGPVTDNAQSVYELSTIEDIPGVTEEIKHDFGFDVDWEHGKRFLENNDGAGNTFKATAKPVLIGTAVVGATTMIFSIILSLTNGLEDALVKNISLLHAPFFLGILLGGAVIYWFSGASMQAVTTGAYRAVEYIKDNIHLDGTQKASTKDSKRVVQICTQYAQKGMINIFIAVFFATLAFAFVEPFLFIGYLIGIAVFGLFQAVYMANAGGAWDNAKKIVETDLESVGTPLHEASVVGDTVGDPFKDTSSVSLNPIIKFSTLFGVLAVSLAVSIGTGHVLTYVLAGVFFLVSATFVWRSFYAMRIGLDLTDVVAELAEDARAAGIEQGVPAPALAGVTSAIAAPPVTAAEIAAPPAFPTDLTAAAAKAGATSAVGTAAAVVPPPAPPVPVVPAARVVPPAPAAPVSVRPVPPTVAPAVAARAVVEPPELPHLVAVDAPRMDLTSVTAGIERPRFIRNVNGTTALVAPPPRATVPPLEVSTPTVEAVETPETVQATPPAELPEPAEAAAPQARTSDGQALLPEADSPFGPGSYVGLYPPRGYLIKGNADSMKFHTPESPYYDRTVAEVWFETVEAARAAGFHGAHGDEGAED